MLQQARPCLELVRPANLLTAAADVLAGFAATSAVLGNGAAHGPALAWLLAATLCLYGGGVAFNDVFDRATDRHERPERPLPSQRISTRAAATLAGTLLVLGVTFAFLASQAAGVLAIVIALLALLYDAVAKHNAFLGPATMGACRGLNLLLGVAAQEQALEQLWFLGAFGFVYIIAVTAVSRGEVRGGDPVSSGAALLLIVCVFLGLALLGRIAPFTFAAAAPFFLFLGWRVFPPFVTAAVSPTAKASRAAVKAGVLSLVFLDATLAAGFLGILWGAAITGLYPLAMLLSRRFSVT